jgi:hypothetical protein
VIEDMDELLCLLLGEPPGEYLVEERGERRLLWRISEGEPGEDALAPSEAWAFKLPEPVC